MEKLYETQEETEKVILMGVSTSDGDDTEESLMELKELVKTINCLSLVLNTI